MALKLFYILDASALLAWLQSERGGTYVKPHIPEAGVSTVNLSEVLQKGQLTGAGFDEVTRDLQALGLKLIDFTVEDAQICAGLWRSTRHLGLSLGDRACLATAIRFQATVLTADRAWSDIQGLPITIQAIR